MSTIAGILNVSDAERAWVNVVGQGLVFSAVNELLAQYNAEVAAQTAVFVERTTENFKERYLLPGGGMLQSMGRQAPAAAVKRYNKWDVAFPLRQYGAVLAGDRVDMAYMTISELDAQLKTIMIQDMNTLRWRILTALFEDTNLSFTDPIHGSLTIRRLANTDGTVYPPLVGASDEADDQHFAPSSDATFVVADIRTIRDEVVEHRGGRSTGNDNVLLLCHETEAAVIAAFDEFVDVSDRFIQAGADTATIPGGLPYIPGRLVGRIEGVWVAAWNWVTDNYLVAVDMEQPAPLVQRADPADTGLGRGLHLVAVDQENPLESAHYEHRFGFGCGNRLSAAVMKEGTSGYSVPSAYAE